MSSPTSNYRLGADTAPVYSSDSSKPRYVRDEQYEREWYAWQKKTGLQRRKDLSTVFRYWEIPGLLENLPSQYSAHRPHLPGLRDQQGLFEDNYSKLRKQLDPQLAVVRQAYRDFNNNKAK